MSIFSRILGQRRQHHASAQVHSAPASVMPGYYTFSKDGQLIKLDDEMVENIRETEENVKRAFLKSLH